MWSEGYQKALELLFRAQTQRGFVASPDEHDNYKRIWTRDGVITGLAALLSEDSQLISTFARTLETILTHQHPVGFMPSNVSPDGKTSYGGTVGRADNPSWAVIGLCQYVAATGDHAMAMRFSREVEKCFEVLDAWEYNGKHLVYVPQSGDWADEYFYHGYVLFDQLLRIWALRLASRMFDHEEWHRKADSITDVVRRNYWNNESNDQIYSANLVHQKKSAPREHWFMGFNPSTIYAHFDLQANSLALLLGIGDRRQDDLLVKYLSKCFAKYDNILPSFYPAVSNSDPEMRELANNYAYGFRNFEHEFHNGGLWSVWNGFLVAGLMATGEQEFARKVTGSIHAANAAGNWDFNECLHGQTKKPIGVHHCTWSAAGAVIAEQSLHKKKLA